MKKRIMLLVVAIAMLGAMLVGCDPAATDVKITLDRTEVELVIGETTRLEATVVGGGVVSWSTSDATTVAITQNGTIQGKKVGTATVTAAIGEVKATCSVTVVANAEMVKDIYLVSGAEAPEEFNTYTLSPTFTPELTSETVTWTTSNAAVATVEDGVVTAVSAGTANITVTASNQATATTVAHVVEYNDAEEATVTITVIVPEELPEYVRVFLRGNHFSWDGGNTEYMMAKDATNPLKWTYTKVWNVTTDLGTPANRKLEWKVVLGTVNDAGDKHVSGWDHEMKKAADNDNLVHFINGGASSTEYHVERWSGIPRDPDVEIEPYNTTVNITINLAEATDKTLYLFGTYKGWGPGDGQTLEQWVAENPSVVLAKDATDPKKYTITITYENITGGVLEFKVTGGDWSDGNRLLLNNDDNVRIDLTEGTINKTFDNVVWHS